MADFTTDGYSNVKINNNNVIEGSLNISIDDGGIETTQLKYEGGTVAKTIIRGTPSPKVTVEWKTPGGTGASGYDKNGITITANGFVQLTGLHTFSSGWDSNWGLVTQHKFIECDVTDITEPV